MRRVEVEGRPYPDVLEDLRGELPFAVVGPDGKVVETVTTPQDQRAWIDAARAYRRRKKVQARRRRRIKGVVGGA